ncbi:AraC-like transcriptional regulator QhpR [Zymomonas mobilis]|uniref:Transcriptional regulator, AraC family n=1 Tax=Zymomonas mobilis subsp. pomaceae (strain ATCC 29192 / DSM 22645 / JCM 10191 / CCUG 17912 / NBRC 13757 / NCIMB 11200 / NRRL B-4491 / Barker I) TaxID=579138 RepID=F8ERV9_ZYMMT|nr:AraC family transcriptional regulator [Zymomonas mobilis]AEI38572.1 transcriptional regulator, AraC family [Zymomonas mobilis subsp. pomaceae ATCC 29192]MDX5948262.1 AraC family transcriptional regulator [Zymomonas mobilis subsp. pomaceae]GEB89017.1 AraC family transcriptional regulator [Zymomonas mobilis subsp. pomaceae]
MTSFLNTAFSQTVSSFDEVHHGVLAAAGNGLGDFIRKKGGDADRVFETCGVDPALMGRPTQSLSLTNYCHLMEEAATNSGNGNFGLHYGKQFLPQNLGLIGYIGLASPTLGDALLNVASDFQWHQHDTLTRFVKRENLWHFEYQVRHGAITKKRQDAELSMGMILNIVRSALGSKWAPQEINFEHYRPEQAHEHEQIFNAPVWFEQPYNSIVLSTKDLMHPMPGYEPVLLTVMRETIRRLNRHNVPQSFPEQVRAIIRIMLPHDSFSLEKISEKMAITPWTLQRRLKEEGVTFLSLVDLVRQEMAVDYMKQTHLTISDITFMLGYSEVCALSRAFRRWFGMSPRAWRKNYAANIHS